MKTYCISDVHGHLDNLQGFTKTLSEDDKVYVLGDVVDKGPKAIECLEYIMNDPRFIMLLGNHEYMMFNLLMAEPGSYSYNDAYDLWINWNEGLDTLDKYNTIPKYRQIRICDYIKKLPLNIPDVKVKDRTFYLVHSCPHSNVRLTMADVEYSDIKIASYVWDRVNSLDKLDIDKQIVIAGHTPVQCYLSIQDSLEEIFPIFNNYEDINKASYIDIDGGLATDFKNSKLIALCLDDLSYKLY